MKIGDTVKILECHASPQLVGKEAEVVTLDEIGTFGGKTYPVGIRLPGTFAVMGFREDELEVVGGTDVPDAFKDALDGDNED